MIRWTPRGRRISLLVLIVSLSTLVAAGCARQPEPPASGDLPGFFTGLVHGFLMFFSLIAGVFTDVRISAFPNSGGWYDLGYVLGASAFWGGGGAGAKSSKGRSGRE